MIDPKSIGEHERNANEDDDEQNDERAGRGCGIVDGQAVSLWIDRRRDNRRIGAEPIEKKKRGDAGAGRDEGPSVPSSVDLVRDAEDRKERENWKDEENGIFLEAKRHVRLVNEGRDGCSEIPK